VFSTVSKQGFNPMTSPAKFNVLRQPNDVFRDVSAVTFTTLNLTGPRPEQVVAGRVSADFFRLFGATLTAGRTFTAAEDRPGGDAVVILSDGSGDVSVPIAASSAARSRSAASRTK
jgi:hypothetical protein